MCQIFLFWPFTDLGFVQEERRLQLEVEFFGDWLHEVASRPPVQDEEAELRIAVPLVHEERSLRLRLLPFFGRKSVIQTAHQSTILYPKGPNLRDSLVKSDLRRRSDDPLDVWVDALQGAEVHLILNRHISILMRNSVPSNIFNH